MDDGTTIDLDQVEILAPLQQELSPAIAAEINQQVATAHRFKRRDIKTISDEIMSWATLNEETASECMYSLERGGKTITGPSIRFAEIARASYGNMRVASRFVRLDLDDPKRGAVIVEAVALDLERNQAESIPVRRSVMTSAKGARPAQVYSADMINMTVNAGTSLARRNAILAVIPKPFWIAAYQRVVKVLQGDANTLGKRRQDIVDAFARIKVPAERVFSALGVKSIEEITLEHMPQLVGFMTAIKEGESPDAVFARTTDGPTHATVNNPLKDQADDGSPTDPKTGEITSGGSGTAAEGAKPGSTSQTVKAETVDHTETRRSLQAGEGQAEPANAGQSPRGAAAAQAHADVIVEDGKVTKNRNGPTGQDQPVVPTNADEYRVHALDWIGKTPDDKARRKQWAEERALRKACSLPEEVLVEISTALNKPAAGAP